MKKTKRLITLALVLTLIISSMTVCVSASKDFADLSSSHWAYQYIQALVDDGTVNGYQDGTFMPESSVTRAEFVKMIGKTANKYDKEFTDVKKDYWGYDYIMYCDMDVDGEKFRPDDVITRNDVLKLLYKRAGSPAGAIAPSIVTNQCDKTDAAAWGYMYGIMQGDDGVNLRLNDGITRAEASALICRSRAINSSTEKRTFKGSVKDEALAEVYDQINAFDDKYDANKTFTYGEMAEATMRLATDKFFVTYADIDTGYSVERPNSYSFFTVCKYVLGEDRMTESVYDSKVTNQDALAMLMFAAKFKSSKALVKLADKNNYYKDITNPYNDRENALLSAAYRNGIMLDISGKIGANEVTTGKTFAMLLMQIDALSGFNSAYVVQVKNGYRSDVSLNTATYAYPSTRASYPAILKNVPNSVYDAPYVDEKGNTYTPKYDYETYRFAKDYSSIFTNFLQNLVNSTKSQGAKVKITFYPSMVTKCDTGYIMKVKFEVVESANNTRFNSIVSTKADGSVTVSKGSTLWVEIATGAITNGLTLPHDNAIFTKVIQ